MNLQLTVARVVERAWPIDKFHFLCDVAQIDDRLALMTPFRPEQSPQTNSVVDLIIAAMRLSISEGAAR